MRQLVDLPVGENLQDHIFLRLPPIDIKDRSVFKYSAANVTFEDFDEFKAHGTGFLAAFDARHEAYIASSRAARIDGHADWPDIQLYLQATFYNGTGESFITAHAHVFGHFYSAALCFLLRLPFMQCKLQPILFPGPASGEPCGQNA